MLRSIVQFAAGAARLMGSIGTTILMILLITLLAASITLPLWLLSHYVPDVYVGIVFAIIGGLVLFYLIRGILRAVTRAESVRMFLRDSVKPVMLRILGIVFGAMLLVLTVTFSGGGKPVPGIIFGLAFFSFLVVVRNMRSAGRA